MHAWLFEDTQTIAGRPPVIVVAESWPEACRLYEAAYSPPSGIRVTVYERVVLSPLKERFVTGMRGLAQRWMDQSSHQGSGDGTEEIVKSHCAYELDGLIEALHKEPLMPWHVAHAAEVGG